MAVKLKHFEFFKFAILKILMVENINTANTKKIEIQKHKWMMLSKMGISFFQMTPLSESTRLSGLLSCFLSALHFQS